MDVYRFRDCLLNTTERSVIKDSEHIELTTRTFDLLQYLIENAGQVVTKDDILGNVWRGNFVEESNLPVHISKIRRSLGEKRNDRFVETVQGIGYRFVAPVHQAEEQEWSEIQKSCRVRRNGDFDLGRPILNSIAVLPLQNESGDPTIDYLVDGLTEGLINGLSHIPGLKVIARNTVFRYKNKDVNLQDFAELLGVSRILTGRVRLAGERLIVGVELINAFDGVQLWGENYNRPFNDIVQTQQEITGVLSARLTAALLNNQPNLAISENAESYRFYLKGSYFLAKRTAPATNKAIESFRKSIGYCPSNAHARAAILDAYYVLYLLDQMSRAEVLALMRPELDHLSRSNQSLDVVQFMQGNLKLCFDWNARAAEHHISAALSANPNFVRAHVVYADIMAINGEVEKAVSLTKSALSLDPISVPSLNRVGATLFKLSEFDEAVAVANEAYELEPDNFTTLCILGAASAEMGDYEKALAFLRESYEQQPAVETLAMTAYVEAMRGHKENAIEVIGQIEADAADQRGQTINLARIYSALGEIDTACVHLERAFDQRSMDLFALGYDPRWNRLRGDDRFESIVRRVREFRGQSI